ncbi:MAG: phosphoenolpyruvate carboxylase [Candidatus Dormibacteria bacterium]
MADQTGPYSPHPNDLDELPESLRAELTLLASVLDQALVEGGGEELLTDFRQLREATNHLRASRGADADRAVEAVIALVDGIGTYRAEQLAGAFTVYFQLVNLAEEHQRARVLRERSHTGGLLSESLAATISNLRSKVGEEALTEWVARISVQPVLTAHPTEARRRAVIDALRRAGELLERLESPMLSATDQMEAERGLREQIAILWRTAQLRTTSPTPMDEVRTVATVFDETLFSLVPRLYRALETALVGPETLGCQPPVFPAFLRWGSWVGGDRDGNPAVSAAVTGAAVEIQAEHCLRALEAAARRLGRALTASSLSTPPSTEMVALLARVRELFPEVGQEVYVRAPEEPHRQVLLLIAERIAATRLGRRLAAYPAAASLLSDLRLIQRSLSEAGASRLAYGELQHLIWQVETFGFTFASLEVRQHSDVHRSALDDLLGGGEWDAESLDRLATEGWPDGTVALSPLTHEVLATLRGMEESQRRWGADSSRRYVVSFTRAAADVVAVQALARLASPSGALVLDVVPLFESRADLQAAPQVLDSLLTLPGWRARLRSGGSRLEVMLGYSDATKDAGFLAANVGLYRAQGELSAWSRRNGVDLTLFHGRGGAAGRGGGPAGRAIRGQAPGSVVGHFKVTEQGEVVFARYGNPAIALRHLEQVTSAVLQSFPEPHQALLSELDRRFAAESELMAESSEAAYRELVDSPGFPEFFAAISPLGEIGRLRIGSRPGRRAGSPELAALRAIPWVFAWSQTRGNIPGWYGLGKGLAAVAAEHGPARLHEMNAEWPFFRSMLENAEMSLSKADPMIAGLYLERGNRPDLVSLIRDEFRLTRRHVLLATGRDHLLAGHPVLRRAVELRNPYVDALSFLQLRFLKEARRVGPKAGSQHDRLVSLVLQTVNGVAAGLQNTG